MSNARQPGGAPVGVGGELVGGVQHRPAVTEGTRALLAGRIPRRIDEELAPAFLRRRMSQWQARGRATLGERLQRLARKEPVVRSLEVGNRVELLRRSARGSPAHADRSRPTPDPAGPGPACRTSTPDRARACSPCSARRERGRRRSLRGRPAGRHLRGSSRSIRIVACAAIRLVPLKKSSRPSWRNSGSEGSSARRSRHLAGSIVPSSPGMAGATGAAVTAEGLMVEEPLTFADFSSGQCQRERRDKQAENGVPRSNEPDDDEDGEQREFSGPAWHDVPPALVDTRTVTPAHFASRRRTAGFRHRSFRNR